MIAGCFPLFRVPDSDPWVGLSSTRDRLGVGPGPEEDNGNTRRNIRFRERERETNVAMRTNGRNETDADAATYPLVPNSASSSTVLSFQKIRP